MDDEKDSRLKYMEMPREFHHRANEIYIAAKQSLRTCEIAAKALAKEKPKTPADFERVEAMKEFLLTTAKSNEKVLDLLKYLNGFLQDIATDAKVLIDGAIIRDRLRDQSSTIEILMQQRDNAVKDIYDLRKDQIHTQQPAGPRA